MQQSIRFVALSQATPVNYGKFGCVAKTGRNSKVRSPQPLLILPYDLLQSVQMASFSARDHPAQRPLVLPLSIELSPLEGDDVRTWRGSGPHNNFPLESSLCA